jgi:putative intracellular protease/amidase
MARVIVPLPDVDFDPTEAAAPYTLLVRAGHDVAFATESGAVPACDPRLLTGVVFGQLGAKPHAIALYEAMARSSAFLRPLRFQDIDARWDAMLLPGGHAPGMRQYLGSPLLQHHAGAFFATGKPVAAICHGVLVLARARGGNGRSVLHGRKTTCLPAYMERTAYFATAWKVGRYYRTYDAYVEDEVRASLAAPTDFVRGPTTLFTHGSDENDAGAFVVEDGNYVSGRWPGDAFLLGKKLIERL